MLQIHDELKKHKISLKAVWLPRAHPLLANIDLHSRFSVTQEKAFDQDSWGFSDEDVAFFMRVFKEENWLQRPPCLDVFANKNSKRFRYYYSVERDSNSLGQNAFNFTWAKKPCYICPPIRCITAVIKHIIASNAEGIITVPVWPSRSFWNMICQDGKHFNELFKSVIFPYRPSFINSGDITSSLFVGKSSFDWAVLYFSPQNCNPFKSNVQKILCVEKGYCLCSKNGDIKNL